jgi:hypothetical protein
MTNRFTVTRTQDGTAIAFDAETGLSCSALSVAEAVAALRRLIARRAA